LTSDAQNPVVETSRSTLLIYFYVLRKRQGCGVREVQRAMGFSSSSTAHYHLERLVNRGILTKDAYGKYRINENARIEVLSRFFLFRGWVFPKALFYATVTTGMTVFLVLLLWNAITLTTVLALLPAVLSSGIFWYDTVQLWLRLPSFEKERSRISEDCSNV
jgi:hypothetical protein